METIKFDLQKEGKAFKLLNCTNGGPWHQRHKNYQNRTNLEAYKAARIPYSRNHDSNTFVVYGGPYAHDITRIFPNFDADPCDPLSYDFECTDESILSTLEAGTKTFFRLGQTIEHQIKKHGTLPPKDFKKWAVICEHIIRHYNEGWGNGYKLDIEYWEIWNEADHQPDDSPNKPTWGGTKAQFFDFYEIAAKHLKSCFPHLKIGGPSYALYPNWLDEFLTSMKERNVPIDFVSWHCYPVDPKEFIAISNDVASVIEKCGYGDAERILNEWNYIKNWTDKYQYSINMMHGIKGATFVLGCISAAQRSPIIDMLMYYDTRPSVFCGAFDYYTCLPLKGYYPLYWYGMFYDMEKEIPSENEIEDIYTLCGVSGEGKVLATLTYYSDDDDAENKKIKLDLGRDGKYEIYLLDEEHDASLVGVTDTLEFDMKVQSALLIKEI